MKIKLFCIIIIFIMLISSSADIITNRYEKNSTLIEITNNSSNMYAQPRNYNELVEWYKNLENNYSDYIEVFAANQLYNVGEVDGGYEDYYVRVTNESTGYHKPEVLFLGSPHGVEKLGTISLYWFVDWLMRYALDPEYETPQHDWLNWLIDNREIYIEISHNPYGFDRNRRWDYNGWDLNREADYNGPGDYGPPNCWGSVTGKTLVRFVNNHTIRTGCDFHEGLRKLMYPWFSSHWIVKAISPISGTFYNYAPPDFYYYDAASLRASSYMGDFGGQLTPKNIGPIRSFFDRTEGALVAWAYGADVEQNPVEDRFVSDEENGQYPGCGIMWHLVEVYDYSLDIPREELLGNDTVEGFGMQIRRYLLHQIDLAQPYIRWIGETPQTEMVVSPGSYTFSWQVNGSLVVDHTSVQWGTDEDPIEHYDFSSTDYDMFAGSYIGGTGWDDAFDGSTSGFVYSEELMFEQPGDYYIVAKAQVDQVYKNTLMPWIYEKQHSYLRLIKERTDDTYYEEIQGTDGTEIIQGQTWWYSPIVHIIVE